MPATHRAAERQGEPETVQTKDDEPIQIHAFVHFDN